MAQAVVAIAPTSASYTGGTGSANSVVTTFTATMSPAVPAFAGTWSITGTDVASFRINASTGQLTVGTTDTPPATYHISVTATP